MGFRLKVISNSLINLVLNWIKKTLHCTVVFFYVFPSCDVPCNFHVIQILISYLNYFRCKSMKLILNQVWATFLEPLSSDTFLHVHVNHAYFIQWYLTQNINNRDRSPNLYQLFCLPLISVESLTTAGARSLPQEVNILRILCFAIFKFDNLHDVFVLCTHFN